MRITKLILAMLLAVPASATVRYINDTGTNSGDCTASDCLTPQYAYTQSSDGDIVKVKAGAYGTWTINTDNDGLSTTGVTFQPDDGLTRADIQYQILDILGTNSNPVRLLTFKSMENLGGSRRTKVFNTDRITFTDMHIRRLQIDGNSSNITIQGTVAAGAAGGAVIGDYDANDSDPQIGQMTSAAGVTSPSTILIDKVWFHDVNVTNGSAHTECLQAYGYNGLTIRNSIFGPNCGGGAGPSTVTTGLRFTGGAQADEVHDNVLIENNFFGPNPRNDYSADFTTTAGGVGDAPTNWIIRNNSFSERVYFNTQVSAQAEVLVQNDIFFNVSTIIGGTTACDHATFTYNRFESGSTCGTNTSTGAVTYVGEASSPTDMHVTSGSTLDVGNNATCSTTDIDGHSRPVNVTCDLGADEAGSSGGIPLNITSTNAPNGTLNVFYTYQLSSEGGTCPCTWSTFSGALPTGATLNTSTGLISGTISASGTFNWVSRVTDDVAATDDQALSATIQDITITIITPALSDAPLNEPYPSLQTEALGGELPLTWTISEGSLPTGLSLSAGGLISGIATTLGSSTFKILVTDSSTPTALTDEREYTMEVVEAKGTCCIPPSP